MTSLPDRPNEPMGENLPARRLTATEVELVLRRAVELQARESDARLSAAEGMSEGELIRIGEELGLSPRHIQQALAETSAEPQSGEGFFGRSFGPGTVKVSRLIRRSADDARADLDSYFRERECMVVHRRFPDRIVYTQGSGVSTVLQKAAAQMGGKYKLLDVRAVEIGVQEVDERSCYVALAVDLRGPRAGFAAGGLVTGGGGGAAAAAFLGIAVAPPAALLGLPILAASYWGARALYQQSLGRMRGQLESLLDRLEHRELAAANLPSWRRRLGF
jgi:hypothetical protein